MKTPAEYIEQHGAPFTGQDGAGPYVDYAAALAAVQSALDDANKYRELLIIAILKSKPSHEKSA